MVKLLLAFSSSTEWPLRVAFALLPLRFLLLLLLLLLSTLGPLQAQPVPGFGCGFQLLLCCCVLFPAMCFYCINFYGLLPPLVLLLRFLAAAFVLLCVCPKVIK